VNPQQEELVRQAFVDLRTISLRSSSPDETNLTDVLDAGGVQHGFIDYVAGTATGYSRSGLAALAELAQIYRSTDSRRSLQASSATLAKLLAATIAKLWLEYGNSIPAPDDFVAVDGMVNEWFASLTHTRLHAVPCIISPYPAPAFDIGPVHFSTWHDFPADRFGVTREEFWGIGSSESKREVGGVHFGSLMKMAHERSAGWVAVVEISGKAEQESKAMADIAVDIALGALKAVAPGLEIRNICRATSSTPPLWRADVWSDGSYTRNGVSNFEPAKVIAPAVFADVLGLQVRRSLDVVGRRLEEYLGASSNFPLLVESWANAAYWFNQAVAEALDTVAVFKLETTIEVLFRSEDMAGSKSRLRESFEAFFGLTGSHQYPGSALTVDQFILNITTARSRVAHGTWPTINTDLPGYRKQKPIDRRELEMIAGQLLVRFAHFLELYGAACETSDSTDTFFGWIKVNR
jgi:hypothetical protein